MTDRVCTSCCSMHSRCAAMRLSRRCSSGAPTTTGSRAATCGAAQTADEVRRRNVIGRVPTVAGGRVDARRGEHAGLVVVPEGRHAQVRQPGESRRCRASMPWREACTRPGMRVKRAGRRCSVVNGSGVRSFENLIDLAIGPVAGAALVQPSPGKSAASGRHPADACRTPARCPRDRGSGESVVPPLRSRSFPDDRPRRARPPPNACGRQRRPCQPRFRSVACPTVSPWASAGRSLRRR